MSIYQKTHIVLLVGDFNACLSGQRGNAQDVLLQATVASNSLEHQQKGVSTFFHPNKTNNAEIDYILFNKIGQRFVKSVCVEKSVALNTSDQVPVVMQMELTVGYGKNENVIMKCKPNWDKCDKQNYQLFIKKNITPFDSFYFGNSSDLDILYPMQY